MGNLGREEERVDLVTTSESRPNQQRVEKSSVGKEIRLTFKLVRWKDILQEMLFKGYGCSISDLRSGSVCSGIF